MKWKLLALALLVAWGAGKLPWERRLAADRQVVMAGAEPPISYQLRDSLGQGLTMAALGGFRGLAADCLWISLTNAWQEREWERVQALAELCVLLQPRVVFFWEMGAWNLAWNASQAVLHEPPAPGKLDRRRHDSMMWIEAGRSMLERGLRVIPERPTLYQKLGDLHWQRLADYARAAEYYQEALRRPGCPVYVERFVGFALEKAGEPRAAYDYWRRLWLSASEHRPDQHRWEVVEEHIRKLETELNLPAGERLFPAPAR